MAKRKKIIVAGGLCREVIYSTATRYDPPKVRAEKRKASSAALQRMNDAYSWQKLKYLLAANFRPGDLVIVLTYDDAHLPETREAANAKLKYFRAKLAKARRARGEELVMFWNDERLHGHADQLQDGRRHHHCVINATGDDYAELARLWGQGDVLIRPLRVDQDKNYGSLARYMCKEAREKVGQRSWSYTRNARKPEVESFRVPDDTTINAPRGSIVLAEESCKSEWASWRYIEYYVPCGRAPRAAKRRKR